MLHKAQFGSHRLHLRYHPAFQERPYAFYHMTHKGNIEDERLPDLRRCERMPWARPTVERTEALGLRFWGLCTFLCTFILRLDSTKLDKMRCWNFWKVKSGLRSTLGITPNTLPPRKRGILAFYRYIIKISTKCVWFCVRLSNTSRAYKNDDKELRPQKTEELLQIYTFCTSYASCERIKRLLETFFLCLSRTSYWRLWG